MNGQPRAGQSARSESEAEAGSEHAARPVQRIAATGRAEAIADTAANVPPPASAGAPDGPDASHAPTTDLPTTDLPTADGLSPAITESAEMPDEAAGGAFGTTLEPVLRRACESGGGTLSTVSWFRTDWQRGGALTGAATYTDAIGESHRVVVKLPVPPCEQQWLAALQVADAAESSGDTSDGAAGVEGVAGPIVPRLHAHGAALNGYDLAWVVMEHLPHGPLGSDWQGREFDLLIEAAGRFYAAAAQFPATGEPQQRDWHALFEQARQQVRDKALPEPQRWNRALKKAQRKLKTWVHTWEQRPTDGWCHGDLHLANALTRTAAPHGPALLIDFARTRVGHWLEDAVYLEHLYWARPQRLGGRKLCRQIARDRKARGLDVEEDWAKLAEAKRYLLAATTPAQLRFDGDPHHLAAALAVLESAVK